MAQPEMTSRSGMSSLLGIVRVVAALAVVLLGTVAALVVLDVLPRSVLSEFSMKILLVAGITAVTIGLATLLLKPRDS
jgi:hypothetical protein